jgi:hypothetical protein
MIEYRCNRCKEQKPPTMIFAVVADIVDDQNKVLSMKAHREWHLCVGCLHDVTDTIERDDQ